MYVFTNVCACLLETYPEIASCFILIATLMHTIIETDEYRGNDMKAGILISNFDQESFIKKKDNKIYSVNT